MIRDLAELNQEFKVMFDDFDKVLAQQSRIKSGLSSMKGRLDHVEHVSHELLLRKAA